MPAWEIPYWRTHFAQEPWGFKAMDKLASKTAMQVASAFARLKPGTSINDFMFTDRFDSGDLTQAEYELLSPEEKDLFLQRQIQLMKAVLN